jgi:hypothetical protein
MPIKGDTRLTFALERPGASADQGDYAGRIELQDVRPNFPAPDFSAEYRHGLSWGYVELAAIARYMKWEDLSPTSETDLSGDAIGWGLNLSSNIKFAKNDVIRLSVVYGEGIQNYMNDAPVDVAIDEPFGSTANPEGVPIPLLGVVGFLEHSWSDKFATAIGYSFLDIDNTEGQSYDAFSKGDYALGNIIYYPVQDVMMVAELQWGKRENFKDSPSVDPSYLRTADILKVQFSFKYNFSHKVMF